ncbi:MAG: undecaprenyldiphospho-muramoylpentapeptide beta-N-acetylglucosaminyltransferase [Prolixibacteraceae bacterium]|nr:undecaprenyldiphospho-muramoylpentapeptide beta-N-acetylglucosaminyltransferase [Prolixibacteraceae bacterium]
MTKKLKIIISGGGTGGHIFPAISIANEVMGMIPDAEILFVGALGRMEMERVPAAGYNIVGLPIMGFPRKPGVKMIKFFFNLARSMRSAHRVVKQFKPGVVVGVGGYASGPVLRVAVNMKIPALIQEQNSYAGITNRLLAKRVDKVCVSYDKMERYFPADKIVHTGNPVRKNLVLGKTRKDEAYTYFSLEKGKKVLLIVGGSLGARTLNQSLLGAFELIKQSDVQVIWQTGSYYYKSVLQEIGDNVMPNLHVHEFISRMDLAYSVADVVVSRAGAGSISELCLMAKPVILVPSPNVAEDHQTKNAMALVEKDAAILIPDSEAESRLISEALNLLGDVEKQKRLSMNISALAKPDAAIDIAKLVIELTKKK